MIVGDDAKLPESRDAARVIAVGRWTSMAFSPTFNLISRGVLLRGLNPLKVHGSSLRRYVSAATII